MNDETSGQLTQKWRIPTYMQTHLWLEGDSGTAQAEGQYGLFELPAPCPTLTLRWGGEQGSALVQLPWQPDSLEWAGHVCVGGYVDAIYSGSMPSADLPAIVVYVGGQPMDFRMNPYPGLHHRAELPYQSPDFHRGVAMDVADTVTTWLVEDASPLSSLIHNALVHNIRLHLWGHFAEAGSIWEQHFAMPILLDGVTLFSP